MQIWNFYAEGKKKNVILLLLVSIWTVLSECLPLVLLLCVPACRSKFQRSRVNHSMMACLNFYEGFYSIMRQKMCFVLLLSSYGIWIIISMRQMMCFSIIFREFLLKCLWKMPEYGQLFPCVWCLLGNSWQMDSYSKIINTYISSNHKFVSNGLPFPCKNNLEC